MREARIRVFWDKTLSSGECPEVSNESSAFIFRNQAVQFTLQCLTLATWKHYVVSKRRQTLAQRQRHISEDLKPHQHRFTLDTVR